MTAALRASQRRDGDEFADGLTAWIRGEDSERADAAASLVAEAVLVYLHSNTKE